ncbi:SirB1 family protein [Holophaga foetida]|uniref:SirB1 family protein n=1 Tax=Holophaga foetida TaxID=35839 RepID=UPI0002474A40|nr:transglutaminase-like domain-containing protein [Holophaga foetida]
MTLSLHEYLQSDPECNHLAEGAVWAVAPMLPDPDPVPFLKELDAWAFELAGKMPLPWSLHKALDALNHFLTEEMGLRGDTETYDRPENAVLPLVVESKHGLPIALSILWIDVARRLGLDAVGIALPGHFITGLRLDVGTLYFDPFNRCRAVGEEDAALLVSRATEGRVIFDPSMLVPVSHRATLTRLTRNLHIRFLRNQLWNDAFWATTHLVLLNPGDPLAYRDRAMVQVRRGDIPGALGDLLIAQSLAGNQDPSIREWIRRLEKT